MSTTLTWHGHANFQIQTRGLSILIDPWFEGNPSSSSSSRDVGEVDLVLVTHDHDDHLGQAVEICRQTKAQVLAVVETAAQLVSSGVKQDQVVNGIGLNIGGTVEFKDTSITMVQATHSSRTGLAAGYIISLPHGPCLYHAGDTGIFSSMVLWGQLHSIDVAMLPIGGVFTMDPPQAALACSMLQCKQVVPMHWGSFPVLEQNTKAFEQELVKRAPATKLLALEPGQSVTL